MRHRLSAVLALAASIAVSSAPVAFADDDEGNSMRGLRRAVTTKGINEHLKAFQFHGDLNGGNRAGPRPATRRRRTT